MRLETLRGFVLLSESLNFSATARQLYVSQSVLSKRIASLEKELGVVLFVRDKHSVRLTAEGRLLAKRISMVLENYDDALKDLERMRRNVNSLLKIGYIHGAAREFLPPACKEFSEKYDDTELEMHSMEADQVVIALRQNEIDLGITTLFKGFTPETMEYSTLFKDSYGLLVPAHHRLAGQKVLMPSDVDGETILIPNEQSFPYYSRFVRDVFMGAKCNVDFVDEMYDIHMVMPFLATERGIAFSLRHHISEYGSTFKYIPIENENEVSIVVMWKKANEKKMIQEFVKCLRRSTYHLRNASPEVIGTVFD